MKNILLVTFMGAAILSTNAQTYFYILEVDNQPYAELASTDFCEFDFDEFSLVGSDLNTIHAGNEVYHDIEISDDGYVLFGTHVDDFQLSCFQTDYVPMSYFDETDTSSSLCVREYDADGDTIISFQMKNAAFKYDSTPEDPDFTNWQLHIYADSVIEMHMGPNSVDPSSLGLYDEVLEGIYVGLYFTGLSSDSTSYRLFGDPVTPDTIYTNVFDFVTYLIDGYPAEGTVYRFTPYFDAPVGIQNVVNENAVRIFPNPATDHIDIASAEDIFQIDVTGLSGQLYSRETVHTTPAIIRRVHIDDLIPGNYIVSVYTGNSVVHHQFSKL